MLRPRNAYKSKDESLPMQKLANGQRQSRAERKQGHEDQELTKVIVQRRVTQRNEEKIVKR